MSEGPEAPALPPLRLREPLPPVVDTEDRLAETIAAVLIGSGPVALDAERASGYRYSARAYLVQLRREGSGTSLVDPIAFESLEPLDEAIGDNEWILHAATQDLMCLAEVGLTPRHLFDTELAGRLLNLPKVGLASLVQGLLGHTLAKEHSAVDWSTRPLPEPWLEYAALDVEVLIELRDALEQRLVDAGKRDWATQEFDALLTFTGPRKRNEPWRRTSGIHKARKRRALALVRELWETRDRIAADRDVTPGRVLNDRAIMEIAHAAPKDLSSLRALSAMRNRGARRHLEDWEDAVQRALTLDDDDLPHVTQRFDGPPPPRAWGERNPAAAARLGACREVVTAIAEAQDVPAENLIAPDTVRRLAWEPPVPVDLDSVSRALAGTGVRPWQIDLVAADLVTALAAEPEV